MGWNPTDTLKSITKPFKKVLKSPIGKAALGIGAFMYGPKIFGAGKMGGQGGWGQAWGAFKNMPAWKQALIAGGTTAAAGAIGDEVIEEKATVIDDTGHKGYLTARKGFVDEWTEWLIDQGHDPDEARVMAEKELFAKAEGGIVGLAQGGRIGMMGAGIAGKGTPDTHAGQSGYGQFERAQARTRNNPPSIGGGNDPYQDKIVRDLNQRKNILTKQGGTEGQFFRPKPVVEKPTIGMRVDDWRNNIYQSGINRNKVLAMRKMGLLPGKNPFSTDIPSWASQMTEEELNELGFDIQGIKDYGTATYNPNLNPTKPGSGSELLGRVFEGQDILDRNNMTQADWDTLFPGPTPTQGGDGPQEEWQRLGYPSYEAYLAAMQGGAGTGGGGTGDTTSDYYGFKEWEDWEGGPTTPLFSDATKYKALLNKGGRIGLYAGGMGAMNNPMNPMMNQGLGAMGSPGMNPYNQQNLMAHAQRGQPTGGRPPMPGGPTTAQGPGITGTQAGAALAKKEDDGDLLKLIRMLASMGIPMEQLRGRTKEELVEMVMSLSAKAKSQGGGQEVIEEQEEVVEAAHGGRVRAAGGLGEMYPPQGSYPNSDLEFQTEEQASMGNPGNAEMYVEDEEEEIYMPRAQGGLMRTGYAMGTEQPIIPSRDGPQIDYRGIGGYQPHGAKEKKDDVRALLAQGEFVVTSDAVKGIGEGDRDLGAKRMYDMMHKYEPIGRALS